MYEVKTKPNDDSVAKFIASLESASKREDAERLLEIFSKVSGYEPKMWGGSIIGFGAYHYKYATGHEGDAALVGFSPRKTRFSLYLMMDEATRDELIEGFGKYKLGVGCIYINKLNDIDLGVLKDLIRASITYLTETFPQHQK